MAEENLKIPTDGNFGGERKLPSADELLAAIEKMPGLNEESKQELRDSILRGANIKNFAEANQVVPGNNPMVEIWIVIVLVLFILMILEPLGLGNMMNRTRTVGSPDEVPKPQLCIYQLPYETMEKLCYIFDQNDEWRKLGVYMKYDQTKLEIVKRSMYKGKSPTSELLSMWGDLNHTVLELFVLLSHMKHYQAMAVIKCFVDKKYYVLIKESVQEVDPNINQLYLQKKLKNIDYKVHPDNFNTDTEKILNIPKENLCVPIISDDNNERSLRPSIPKSPVNYGRSKMITASDISCVTESAGPLPSIPYEELQKSTNNWDENAVLGRGGFGKVFKGTWKCTQVAIKRLEQKGDKPEYETEQINQSIRELQCLNAYRHDNVLPLYGYSIGGPHPCLIYQYMAGGSLDYRLRVRIPQKVLSWPSRLNIAVGTARGLQFLHTINENAPLVHGDIKCANILLDANDQPRIGDFGLAREGPRNNLNYIKVSRLHGTRSYLPGEFLRSRKFSTKVDTYSFGVVLFELATALAPHSDHREDKLLRDHVVNFSGDVSGLKDGRAKGFDECFAGIVEIGKMCVQDNAKDRPEMTSVLVLLEGVSLKE
ncbi:unnamed protein product [Phaedon cochleariae]|uniref:non-specific serine/threonine protein kinase n=1 Tax=Phaedon cochleariae TaxID=80249 RepID=A0A9N9SFX2_PHACE|nr:unnamed protein product [Phaedon cochleariae]